VRGKTKWLSVAAIVSLVACTESALQLAEIEDGVDSGSGAADPVMIDAGRNMPPESVDAPVDMRMVFVDRANGVGCRLHGDCASGFCIDGVCCNSSCAGRCEACDVDGRIGQCIGTVAEMGCQPPSCAVDTWDHDANPATACVAKRNCLAGTYVTSPGSSMADRTCAACPSDSYSPGINAPKCVACGPCDFTNDTRSACVPIVGCVDCGPGTRPNPSRTACVDIDECVENIAVCAYGPEGPEVEIGGPQNDYCATVIWGSCCFNLNKVAGEKAPAPLMSTPTNTGLGYTLWDPLSYGGFYCET
jgi:hypothetical protein